MLNVHTELIKKLSECHSLLYSNAAIYSFRTEGAALTGLGELHCLFRSCNCLILRLLKNDLDVNF